MGNNHHKAKDCHKDNKEKNKEKDRKAQAEENGEKENSREEERESRKNIGMSGLRKSDRLPSMKIESITKYIWSQLSEK